MRSKPTLARFSASAASRSQSHGFPGSVFGAGTVIRLPFLSKNLPHPIRLTVIRELPPTKVFHRQVRKFGSCCARTGFLHVVVLNAVDIAQSVQTCRPDLSTAAEYGKNLVINKGLAKGLF